MHLLVVNSAQAMATGAPRTAIRFVANAAGPLLPSVAIQLRNVFPGAAVLTSYGMTECMPITCPPPGYALERAGSSGQAICPDVAIVDDAGERVSDGRVAHIVVRGDVVTRGYENDPEATAGAFFPGGWFKTGDMGWMDADGYLYVTGRSKEVINRGGEIISPAEVEEALLSHPGVSDVVAISVPHATLQETVGVVVVTTKGIQDPGLRQLCQHASDRLPPAKWPQCLVLVEKIPRIGPTGKSADRPSPRRWTWRRSPTGCPSWTSPSRRISPWERGARVSPRERRRRAAWRRRSLTPRGGGCLGGCGHHRNKRHHRRRLPRLRRRRQGDVLRHAMPSGVSRTERSHRGGRHPARTGRKVRRAGVALAVESAEGERRRAGTTDADATRGCRGVGRDASRGCAHRRSRRRFFPGWWELDRRRATRGGGSSQVERESDGADIFAIELSSKSRRRWTRTGRAKEARAARKTERNRTVFRRAWRPSPWDRWTGRITTVRRRCRA